MKTLVDCDFVFDVLTRGPYPPIDVDQFSIQQRIDSQSIENHLANCHECRQLAEALAPCTEMFHEALSDEERASLPSFNDVQMMARLHSKIIEAVFESEEDPDMVRRVDRACQRWLAPSMAIVPLIAACVLLWLFSDPTAFSRSPSVASLSQTQMGVPNSLREMDLPADCLTPISLTSSGDSANKVPNSVAAASKSGGKSEVEWNANTKATKCAQCHKWKSGNEAPIDKHHFRCCTSCHAAGNEMPRVGGLPKFAASCSSCHATK